MFYFTQVLLHTATPHIQMILDNTLECLLEIIHANLVVTMRVRTLGAGRSFKTLVQN